MVREFTAKEVSKHNTSSDCWLIINGCVYDVTSFLSEHPAGKKIILLHAGKDVTSAFFDIHAKSYIKHFIPNSFIGIVSGSDAHSPALSTSKSKIQYDVCNVLAIKRDIFGPEHEKYRQTFRKFIQKEIAPHYSKYERRGRVDVSMYQAASRAGFYLRQNIPKQYGGLGLTDWRYNAIVAEELEHCDVGGVFMNLGNDMVLSYFTHSCTSEQKQRWLPTISRGAILAVAMSEPEIGSDLGALTTRAEKTRDGKAFRLNGRKMWISSGSLADLVVVACRTDPSAGYRGISLLVVQKSMQGFSCAKRVKKIGKHAQDTCLLTFNDVYVPIENLIGEEGKGFIYLMKHLPKERLSIAVGSVAAARRALCLAVNYVHGREAFGGKIGNLQSVQMQLAKLRTDVQVATTFIDRCIVDVSKGTLSTEAASMAKAYATDLSVRIADKCLQLHGGYGYLHNSPIAKIFIDQRVTQIYGGSNEVMLEIVAKGLGFKPQRFMSKL